MKEKNKYLQIGIISFAVLACAVLFFFFVYRFQAFVNLLKAIVNSLFPVVMGLVVAYLLSPAVNSVYSLVMKLLEKTRLSVKKQKKMSNGLSIAIVMIIFLILVFLLFRIVLPDLANSINTIVQSIPDYYKSIYQLVSDTFSFNPEIQEAVLEIVDSISNGINGLLKDDNITSAVTKVTSVTFSAFKTVINVFLGLCVAVYVLISKQRFIGQAKKLLYASFKKEKVNVLLALTRQADSIFGGFISGKIIDSFIIGILCFLGCSLMHTPYKMLVSVVVGITNIIPLFGPWMGAIPSILLVLSNDPTAAILFAIFVLALQQFDGNILGPNILGDSTGLPAFWVVFAISLGGGLFGVLGMILGVPTFAVLYFLVKTLVEFKLKAGNMPTESTYYTNIRRIDPETGNNEYIKKAETVSKRELRKQNVFEEAVSREIATAARLSREQNQRSLLRRINNAINTLGTTEEEKNGIDKEPVQ